MKRDYTHAAVMLVLGMYCVFMWALLVWAVV